MAITITIYDKPSFTTRNIVISRATADPMILNKIAVYTNIQFKKNKCNNFGFSCTNDLKDLIDARRGNVSRTGYVLQALYEYLEYIKEIPIGTYFINRSDFFRAAIIHFISSKNEIQFLLSNIKTIKLKPVENNYLEDVFYIVKDYVSNIIISFLYFSKDWNSCYNIEQKININFRTVQKRINELLDKFPEIFFFKRMNTTSDKKDSTLFFKGNKEYIDTLK